MVESLCSLNGSSQYKNNPEFRSRSIYDAKEREAKKVDPNSPNTQTIEIVNPNKK